MQAAKRLCPSARCFCRVIQRPTIRVICPRYLFVYHRGLVIVRAGRKLKPCIAAAKQAGGDQLVRDQTVSNSLPHPSRMQCSTVTQLLIMIVWSGPGQAIPFSQHARCKGLIGATSTYLIKMETDSSCPSSSSPALQPRSAAAERCVAVMAYKAAAAAQSFHRISGLQQSLSITFCLL